MGYYEIPNLEKDGRILNFKSVYALEKIHGTSAYISFLGSSIIFSPGGASYKEFRELFNEEKLTSSYQKLGVSKGMVVAIYGEAYGGKEQGMRKVYGDKLKFICFEVKFNDSWLNVPSAESLVKSLGLDFVHYDKVETNMAMLNELIESSSPQGILNGMPPHIREGIVLRPLEELYLSNGKRIIAKYKSDNFKPNTKKEKTQRELALHTACEAVSQEIVTWGRLLRVIKKLKSVYKELDIKSTPIVCRAMYEDIASNANTDINETPLFKKAVGKITAEMYKNMLKGGRVNAKERTYSK